MQNLLSRLDPVTSSRSICCDKGEVAKLTCLLYQSSYIEIFTLCHLCWLVCCLWSLRQCLIMMSRPLSQGISYSTEMSQSLDSPEFLPREAQASMPYTIPRYKRLALSFLGHVNCSSTLLVCPSL